MTRDCRHVHENRSIQSLPGENGLVLTAPRDIRSSLDQASISDYNRPHTIQFDGRIYIQISSEP
ncbi:unnamed protein product, partial [Staurois parvus]